MATTPSLGYFGGNWFDRLDVHHGGLITRVTIERADTTADFLNLRGVLARQSGQLLQFDSDQIEIRQSSVRRENNFQPQGLSSLENLHTMRETNPWWQVRLSAPTRVDAFQIFNRADCLGMRSRAIRLTIHDEHQQQRVIYDSTTIAHRRGVLKDISTVAGGTLDEAQVVDLADARRWRNNAVRAICEQIRRGMPIPDRPLRNALCSLLPTSRPSNNWDALQGDDWFLLAYILCVQVDQMPGSRSAYRNFEFVLPTREHLERLDSEMGDVARSIGTKPMQLLRHGISPVGELREKIPQLQTLVQDLSNDLQKYKTDVMAAYGTLLGGIRNGRLIDHDDDLDIFATVRARTRAEFDDNLNSLRNYLRELGWNVTPNGKYFNSHITKPGYNATIDLFGLWVNGSTTIGHMNNMNLLEMPTVWFEKGENLIIDGINIPAPKCAEEFLRERYGPNWRTPDKYHDWRWKLQ